jgi:hypothetical protein
MKIVVINGQNHKGTVDKGVRTKSWTEYHLGRNERCIQKNNITKHLKFMRKQSP